MVRWLRGRRRLNCSNNIEMKKTDTFYTKIIIHERKVFYLKNLVFG